MADEPLTEETVALPPKQSPFKTVTPAAPAAGAPAEPRTVIIKRPTLRRPGEAPKPVTLKPPIPGQPVVQPLSQTANVAKGIEISHADAAKKVTSRISVSSATAPIPPVTPAVPAATPIAAAAPAAPAPASEKKVTSRISLEAAFSAPSEMPDNQPRTIKLKRPGAPSIPAPESAPSPISPAAPAASSELPPGMTPIANLDGAASAATDENITRRKTIKIKRPGAEAAGGPKIQLTRPDGIATPEDNLQALSNFGAQAKPVVEPDKVNPIFVIAAVLAIVIGGLLSWVLASQTYGERGAAGDFALPKGPNVAPPPWLHPID